MREERRKVVLLGFAHESRGSVHQLLEVLDPVGAVPLRLVVRDEAAFLEHHLHRLRQGQLFRLGLQRFDQANERGDRVAALAGEPACGLVKAAAARLGLGRVLQLLERP